MRDVLGLTDNMRKTASAEAGRSGKECLDEKKKFKLSKTASAEAGRSVEK